ncbi:sporulation protein YqfC [Bacillus sp. AGMB 02131]|uniref:Sporulation protein YqfC n=1 Tax=Peribacillus faecalis TaxID=2772559 RepID=A0A927HAH9_9BACI|nr:sporulation protein YqfC [Peribacillus faecalis]MBD3107572.1 sporulation protein YqfC [Peribacillus faecalis]
MAKKWSQKLKQMLANTADLPKDVMLDLPRITMIGQLHIYIENHRGLIAFKEDEIRLTLTQGQLSIKGNQFIIKAILPEEILVEGVIQSVTFINN